MPYLGTIDRATSYTLEIVTSDKVAVNVLYYTNRGMELEETLLFDPFTPLEPRTLPRAAKRMVFEAYAFPGQSTLMKITQGTTRHEIGAAPDVAAVLDVV